MPVSTTEKLVKAAKRLRDGVDGLTFSPPVVHVYNPLNYAWEPHQAYLRTYGTAPKRVLFLGMNPGPFGMAQTGVPFGEIKAVRDWMQILEPVSKPASEHKRRPIQGFDCPRSEVSGRRLWGLFQARFGSAQAFFKHHFVVNYCPLVFVEATGCNRTPDKLPVAEKASLMGFCDRHLSEVIEILEPNWIIGIGRFAKDRAEVSCGTDGRIKIGTILHPSPACPASNRDWEGTVTEQLLRLGVWDGAD